MHVDHPEGRNPKQLVWQELAICGNDAEVGLELGDLLEEPIVSEPFGLENRDAAAAGDILGRGRCEAMASATRAVRLRDERNDTLTRIEQPSKRWDRKLGRTEVDDVERSRRYHFPARFSF
jgi:hypothetical protein